MLLVYTVVDDSSVGPACYSPSCVGAVVDMAALRHCGRRYHPLHAEPDGLGLAGLAGFFGPVFTCAFSGPIFRLPEPKGRTLAELDVPFCCGVRAREFKDTPVDVVQNGETSEKILDN